jgi:hypothetical protein
MLKMGRIIIFLLNEKKENGKDGREGREGENGR